MKTTITRNKLITYSRFHIKNGISSKKKYFKIKPQKDALTCSCSVTIRQFDNLEFFFGNFFSCKLSLVVIKLLFPFFWFIQLKTFPTTNQKFETDFSFVMPLCHSLIDNLNPSRLRTYRVLVI